MKKLHLIFILAVMALYSCTQDEITQPVTHAEQEPQTSSVEYKYAFAVKGDYDDESQTRAYVHATAKWDQKSIIDIVFLNGSPAVQQRVKDIASIWQQHINLRFNYVNLEDLDDIEDALVKISFYDRNSSEYNQDRVSWSYWGQKALEEEGPTMNIVLFDHNSSAELNSVDFQGQVLRLFGLMLGLVYEHQGYTSNVTVNLAEAIPYYMSLGWDFEQISKWLSKLNKKLGSNGIFDQQSIMLMYIPNYLVSKTKEDGQPLPNFETQNNILSENDITFISSLYPKKTLPIWIKGETGSVFMSMSTSTSDPSNTTYGLAPWDFDNKRTTDNSTTCKTYKTIGVGEYIWTAENLRIRYRDLWGTLFNRFNITQQQVNAKLGNSNYTVDDFEDVFGTWATEYSAAYAYRAVAKFYTSRGGVEEQGWDLPTRDDILQILGHMPVKYADIVNNTKNFFYADKDIDNMPSFGLINMESWESISGLAVPPMGFMTNNFEGERNHYSFGYGFGLKMKDPLHMFIVSDAERVAITSYSYHFCSARYCKQRTDLTYKLYVDAARDRVVVLKSNVTPSNGWVELPKGLERGVTLRYTDWDEKTSTEEGYVVESWSNIQAEAAKIRSSIRFY